MLILKLQRVGKKHQAIFRLIIGEKRHKLNGKQKEYLGWYNPAQNTMKFNADRILHWLRQGAQKTATVHNLLIRSGIINGSKIAVHNKPKKTAVSASVSAPAPTAEPQA